MKRLVLVAALILPLAACTDNNNANDTTTKATTIVSVATSDAAVPGGGSTTPTADSSDVTASSTVTDETTPETDDPSAPGHGTEFCKVNTELNNTDSPFSSAEPDPAATKEFFTVVFPALVTKLAAAAPPELVDSVKVLGDGIIAFGKIVEKNNWDINVAYNDPAVAGLLGTLEFQTAGGKVSDYCGS